MTVAFSQITYNATRRPGCDLICSALTQSLQHGNPADVRNVATMLRAQWVQVKDAGTASHSKFL